MKSFEQRVAALRRADEKKLLWEQAGEELLIEQGDWIRQDEFCAKVMVWAEDNEAIIRWEQAREVLAEAMTGPETASNLIVLAFAVALGTDRFGLSQMDIGRRQQTLAAIDFAVQDWTNDKSCPPSLSAALLAHRRSPRMSLTSWPRHLEVAPLAGHA